MIKIENVTKKFQKRIVLENISGNFEAGSIHGIIGRNGSGKTVLLKCICGFLSLDAGEIKVAGKKVDHSCPKDIGIILETPGFVNSMSGFRNLKMLASIRNQIKKEDIMEVMTRVGLDPNDKRSVQKYSLGMKQRLAIAQAIMEKPKLILLDEPMNGLDKNGVVEIRNILLDLKKNGTTILLASHYAEDVELLCDTVWEMDQGKMTQQR